MSWRAQASPTRVSAAVTSFHWQALSRRLLGAAIHVRDDARVGPEAHAIARDLRWRIDRHHERRLVACHQPLEVHASARAADEAALRVEQEDHGGEPFEDRARRRISDEARQRGRLPCRSCRSEISSSGALADTATALVCPAVASFLEISQ